MARYVATVTTSRPIDDVFASLVDLTGFAAWDPGVSDARLVSGETGTLGAEYDLTVEVGSKQTVMRYRITEVDPPRRLQIVGKTRLLTSIDVITLERQADLTVVEYDALLLLPRMLRLLDGLLTRPFERVGDRAAHGLAEFVAGEWVRA
jgi:hypothetical protein